MSGCKPGDLAVVISAAHPENIGRIVRVIELHHGKGPLAMVVDCPLWMVECPSPMIWSDGRKPYIMTRGPVPDSQLRPIKGDSIPKTVKKTRKREVV